MDIPTVLGRTVLVEGCTVFPSVQALTALDPGIDRPGALLDTLAQLRDYEQALLNLQADTMDALRERGWPWKWIAMRFRLRSPGSAWSLRDRRRMLREVQEGTLPPMAA